MVRRLGGGRLTLTACAELDHCGRLLPDGADRLTTASGPAVGAGRGWRRRLSNLREVCASNRRSRLLSRTRESKTKAGTPERGARGGRRRVGGRHKSINSFDMPGAIVTAGAPLGAVRVTIRGMARARIHATDAERQKAYRIRKGQGTRIWSTNAEMAAEAGISVRTIQRAKARARRKAAALPTVVRR